MKNIFLFCLVLGSSAFLFGCKKENDETQAVIEVTLVNMGFTAWKVVSVTNSTNFAQPDINNSPFTFQPGRRYRIISMANVAVHPFEFRNAANMVMLSQNPMNLGSLATDASVNFMAEGNSIEFTVSHSFQSNVVTYNCANHNGMKGNVVFD
jgi:hypothetical protein